MTDYSPNQIISFIQHRLRDENQGFNIVFTGAVGSGKSYACMDFCKLVDPTFDTSRITWSEVEFLKMLDKEMVPGSAIMLDEAGIYMDSREFMTMINKLLTYVTMTMRHRRQLVALTVPSMKWIDLKTRELLHAYVEMVSPGVGRLFLLQTNFRYGKTYFHLPKVERKYGKDVCDSFKFELIEPVWVREYEDKKMDFTRKLIKDSIQKIEVRKMPASNAKINYQDILDDIKSNRKQYTKRSRLDVGKIQLQYNLSNEATKSLRRILKAKGMVRTSAVVAAP
jgi:hypothetical protein